jgi:hypothetical protein
MIHKNSTRSPWELLPTVSKGNKKRRKENDEKLLPNPLSSLTLKPVILGTRTKTSIEDTGQSIHKYRVQEEQEEQEESYASDYTDEHVDMPGEHYEARKRKEEQREEQPRQPRQYYRRNDQGPPSGGGSDDSYPQGPGGPRRNVPRAPRIPKINNPPGLPRQLYNQQPPQNIPAPIGLKIKTKEPDVFDGASSKLDDWFRQIDSYFVLQSAIFVDDDAKVLSALQYIRGGTAGQWAAHHAQAFLNARKRRTVLRRRHLLDMGRSESRYEKTIWRPIQEGNGTKEDYGQQTRPEDNRSIHRGIPQTNPRRRPTGRSTLSILPRRCQRRTLGNGGNPRSPTQRSSGPHSNLRKK